MPEEVTQVMSALVKKRIDYGFVPASKEVTEHRASPSLFTVTRFEASR